MNDDERYRDEKLTARYGDGAASSPDAVPPLDSDGPVTTLYTRAELKDKSPGYQTESARYIFETILPEWKEMFWAKNADYGDQHRTGLGPRAEFVGLHRKLHKLRQAIWEGQEMAGEQPREMLMDLIGQCFIMIDLLDLDSPE